MYMAYMGDHYQIIPLSWGLQSSEEDESQTMKQILQDEGWQKIIMNLSDEKLIGTKYTMAYI